MAVKRHIVRTVKKAVHRLTIKQYAMWKRGLTPGNELCLKSPEHGLGIN